MGDELSMRELLEAFLPEDNTQRDEIANNNLLDDLVGDNVRDLAEDIKSDIWMEWVLGNDRVWYLCCKCDNCDVLMQYPGVHHICPAQEDKTSHFQTREVITSIPTSMDELMQGLLCDETFLSAEN